ncbi:hypothetical protein POM88_044932 [Heracleum sosnowskyi]|uniref:Calmodulin-binding domain-containing protein n=1 Tax=Heracleum sosnowskyi TaxID=360622 RepID=A0AAD8H5G7_9APIA|nr:hypothetical protein POM88_044932 [Heracleum sosnowskyi]
MVQRKLADKLGIQSDHVESKKWPSPSQNQDNKNKVAADLNKMMEKSRTIQHPDLRSKDIHIPKPGKPTTSDHVKTRAATPQRQSSEGSPHYMKSTSSFDARRERSQVSSQTPQNVMIRKSMSPVKSNNFRHNSGSDHKPVGAVARISSLKVVRTLIKIPNFKPARALTKKYPPISLCQDFDVVKPTCSSTLKDSKMPMFLELSTGATESKGTSAMKVCPYTYCSLNGHHHDPQPPLKSFLSEKRRMLKAQKVIKLGCLSEQRPKPSQERKAKNEKQVILAEIPPTEDIDFDSRPVTPLMHEKQTDFLVEIYRNNKDDDTGKGKIPGSLSSTAPGFVIALEGNLEAEKDQNIEEGAEIHPFPKTQEGDILDRLSTQCNTDEKSQQISQHGQSGSEASEMDLKERHHCEPSLDDVFDLKMKVTDIYNGSNFESISISYNNSNSSYEDILKDAVWVGFYDEKSVSSGAWSDDGDSDLDGSYRDTELEKPYSACNEQIQGKMYSTCDGNRESIETQVRENSISRSIEEFQETSVEKSKVPEASTGEKNGNSESIETQVKENSISHPLEEFQATSVEKYKIPEANDKIPKMNLELGSDAINCISNAEEVVFGLHRDEAAKQEHVSWLLYQDCIEQEPDETHKTYITTFSSVVVFELDSTSESRSSDDVLDKSFSAKTEYEDANQEDHEGKISTTDARDGMEEKEPLAAYSLVGIRTSDSLREIEKEKPIADATEGMERKEELLGAQHLLGSQPFEMLQEIPKRISVGKDQSKQTDVTVLSETTQSYADETLPFESTGVQILKATPNQNQEVDTGEGESRTEPDTAETSIISKASHITQKRDHMSNANRTSNQEMTQIAEHLSWTTGSRKIVAELEDIRDFNPREPNYLPEQPDLEPEKVDLRHQLMDERKNSEEWMVDYALRQAVNNLAPKRRRKVSLLVEAFEKVLPTPKYETRPSHTSSAFINAGTTQTCR